MNSIARYARKSLVLSAAALLAATAVPAFAGHEAGHDSVARGGIKALDERLFDEESKPKLGDLACTNTEIAKFNGVSWACAADEDIDTSAADCPSGEVLTGGGSCVALGTFVRTLVVSPFGDGSNTTLNGDELLAALTFLGTVAPAPGAANPWLIKVEPGIYDVGATSVQMLPYVDIEGSGQGVTEITGTVDGTPADNPGVVTMADHTEIRHVTPPSRSLSKI